MHLPRIYPGEANADLTRVTVPEGGSFSEQLLFKGVKTKEKADGVRTARTQRRLRRVSEAGYRWTVKVNSSGDQAESLRTAVERRMSKLLTNRSVHLWQYLSQTISDRERESRSGHARIQSARSLPCLRRSANLQPPLTSSSPAHRDGCRSVDRLVPGVQPSPD